MGSMELNEKKNIKRTESIKATINLLDRENIVRILYIDDKFDLEGQKEEFIGRIKSLKLKGDYIDTDIFADFDWEGPDEIIDELWNNSDDKVSLLKTLFDYVDEELKANLLPALEIVDNFKRHMVCFTPDEWIDDNFESLKSLNNDEKALCLFDFEFQKGNNKWAGKNGVQLAEVLLSNRSVIDKVICGIFSSKFAEEEEEEKRNEFAEKYNITKDSFYTISKYRYYNDPLIAGFSEGIKNLLLHPYVEDLKKKSLKILQESNAKAKERIEVITPKTFNQIIQKSSLKEGIWEVSTLFRMYGILSKEENFKQISDAKIREDFNKTIERIRSIDETNTGYVSSIKNEQLILLRESELYLPNDIINKLHLPLSNGDIFNIKNKKYVLLVQPCNIAIRAGKNDCGSRSKSYSNAFLIPLKEFDKDQLNHTKQEVLSSDNDDKKILCAYFPEFKVLSLDYLDLAVFNEEGKSCINMNHKVLNNSVIHFPWKKRYEDIYNKFKHVEEKIKSFIEIKSLLDLEMSSITDRIKEICLEIKELIETETETETEQNFLKQELKTLGDKRRKLGKQIEIVGNSIYSFDNFDNFGLNGDCNYDLESRIFTFDIVRDKHYKSPYSDDLLQKFMLYLSRNAFEHDFTI